MPWSWTNKIQSFGANGHRRLAISSIERNAQFDRPGGNKELPLRGGEEYLAISYVWKQKLFIAGKPLNAYKTVRNWVRIQGYTTIWIVSSCMPSIAAVSDKQMLQMGEI
jgi:hypothetical protein